MTGRFEFNITEKGTVPRGMKRQANNVNRAASIVMGERWHREFRPKHFTRAGATEYEYYPRQGDRGRPYAKGFHKSYTGRKLKQKGHTRPLVWSGDSERLAAIRDIRAVAKKGTATARVIIHARTFNLRYEGSQIDMRGEMTTVSLDEAEELTRTARDEVLQRYQQIREERKQKIT